MVLVVLVTVIFIWVNAGGGNSLQAGANIETTSSKAYPGLNLETRIKETDHYTYAISTPITESAELNQPIKEWIKTQEKDFLANVKANKPILDSEDFRAHLNIQIEPKKASDSIYTLVFEAYQITGGANGRTEVKTFTVNTAENKFVRLEDVLHLDDESQNRISSIIKAQISEDEKIQVYIIDEWLNEALANPSGWRWSLSQKNFTLYFNEYEIAAGAAGPVKVKIPVEQISPLLKEEMALLLKIPVTPPAEPEPAKPEDIALNPNGKYIALTFDDGPNPKVTPLVLDLLKEYDAKATFYMIGSQAQFYPTIASRVAEEGHEVGNHTDNHPDLSSLGQAEIRKQIEEASKKIEEASGQLPATVRPPYGAMNEEVKKVAMAAGTPLILWSVDSLDWKVLHSSTVTETVLKNAVPGSIVLFHDIHKPTAEALPAILASLKKEGYEFITVSQLLSLQEQEVTGTFYGKRY
jgi:peptidoglycan/xylan/chitin deacetylase (PgdA/CDA1 family)